MSDLTASDVLAMNSGKDSFLEVILILFILLFGMNGVGGIFGNRNSGDLTRAELYDGLNMQDVQNSINCLSQNMNNGFANVNSALCQGFAGVNMNVNQSTNSINENINALAAQMASCCCEIKTAVHSEGEQTRALIQANTIQDLRDRLADKDRELLSTGLVTAQTIHTNNLENYMRTLINGCGCGY